MLSIVVNLFYMFFTIMFLSSSCYQLFLFILATIISFLPQVPGKMSPLTIALVVVALLLSLLLLGIILFWWRRSRQRAAKDLVSEPVSVSLSGTLSILFGSFLMLLHFSSGII